MSLVNQADFARLHNVSRKTVTTWKKRGYIEISGGLVDVERSNAKLAGVGRAWPQGVTNRAPEVTGNAESVRTALLWDNVGPDREWIGTISAMIDPYTLAELLLRHLPQAMVRPLVAEYVTKNAKAGAEMLNEMGVTPPIGFGSWEDHPWFNPILTDDEWAEYEAEAKVHMAGADA